MMIGASLDSVAMVEGEMKEISEAEMVEAIKFAHEAIKVQIHAQLRLQEAFGKKETRTYEGEKENEEIYKKVKAAAYDKIYAIAKVGSAKHERSAAFAEVKEEVKALFTEEELAADGDLVSKYFYKTNKEAVRNVILELGIRLDGRKTTEIRPIWCETDYLPSVHGSSLFTRGETQALATVTLGTSREANQIDSPSEQGEEKFYLHYNFPPFSTGEAKPLRGTSRREVGHGNLAQRALKNMIPADCPYTIRIVSEVLESNGSSSMATVCAGTMALMEAGVQMVKPVSGIAMGLITDGRLQVTMGEEKQIINITYNDKKRHGGKVYYLECPVCKLRVRFLYVKKTGIACRTCQNLTYESSQCKNKYTGLAKSIFEGTGLDEKFAKSFFRNRQARN